MRVISQGLSSSLRYGSTCSRLGLRFAEARILPRSSGIASRGRSVSTSTKASSLSESMIAGIKNMMGKNTPPAAPSRGALNAAQQVPDADPRPFSDNAPSWEELALLVEQKSQDLHWAMPDMESGASNPLSLRRTFGSTEEPRVKLYRDHAAWCPYCQKVWLQLEEKRIPYVIEKINMRCYGPKPPEFMAKVPSGLLPVIEIDGRRLTESSAIMAWIEAEFPDHLPLALAANDPEFPRYQMLMRLERRLFGDWLQWLTNGWGSEGNKKQFCATMDAIDSALALKAGPWFLDNYSLVDIVFAPFLERVAASIPYYKGFVVRGSGRFPNIDRWFDALEQRPAYLGTRSDYFSHVHDLPPQIGGCVFEAGSEPFAAAIDGTDGFSWHLPLETLSSSSVEGYSPEQDFEREALRAAYRLVNNHTAVVRFALRGPGEIGRRPVSAPLSDPSATPAMEYLSEVDAGMRHVAHALLVGVEAKQAGDHPLKVGKDQPISGFAVVPSAAYLRGRVGVPRDLPLPAARQLRAHCNWLIESLVAA